VYFDARFPGQHCYLPSLPPREFIAECGEDAKPQDVHFTFLRSGTG
jgi:hypothetical protein